MKTDLSPTTADVSLLPRADLPVIWDAFKAKADALRSTAETLTVTCITQKEEMALARTTRLTLREIRIAVENKRVELGESHLKEIKKVNGAATAIKEFIQPLEARLLLQESFAEQHEVLRIAGLASSRFAEVTAIRPHFVSADLGKMSQADYDSYVARLRDEVKEIEAANRLRIEAEKRLAEAQAEALRVAEITRATIELAQRVALEEKNRRDAEVRAELGRQRIILQQERDAAAWKVQQERVAADGRLAEAKAAEAAKAKEIQDILQAAHLRQREEAAAHQAQLDAAKAVRDADLAEQKRIRDIQYAALEAELNIQRAAKLAEEKRKMELALAPDVEKLWQFAGLLRGIGVPGMSTPAGASYAVGIHGEIQSLALDIEATCKSWGLTGK